MCPSCRSLVLVNEYEDSNYCWMCDEGYMEEINPDEIFDEPWMIDESCEPFER